jgi:hypothetical protein
LAVKKMGYSGAGVAGYLVVTTSLVNRLAGSEELPGLDRSSPVKEAFNWSYPVEMHGSFYIWVVHYVPM